jgi:hypothetical protein
LDDFHNLLAINGFHSIFTVDHALLKGAFLQRSIILSLGQAEQQASHKQNWR